MIWIPQQRQKQDLLLADNPFFMLDGDCVLDEITLYSRVLAETEVLALGQRTDPPIAIHDRASAPESATTVIDVLSIHQYVGASPTLSVVAQPSGGDSATVNGSVILHGRGGFSRYGA